MACAALFGLGQLLQVLLVVGLEVGLVEREGLGHRVDVKYHILHVGLLGRLEEAGLVVLLDIGIAHRHLALEVGRLQAQPLQFAPLEVGIAQHLGHRSGNEAGVGHALQDLAAREVRAHAGPKDSGVMP